MVASTTSMVRVMLDALMYFSFLIMTHLLLPPPPREPPMLDEPRELLLRALLPLYPPEPPLSPLELRDPALLGTLRFPTRSPPAPAPAPAPPPPPRFALVLPPPALRLPASRPP